MSIRHNTFWNLAGSAIPLIPAIIFIPFILQRLGNEAFGVLTLIWALIGYFSLFDVGVGRALTYKLSKLSHEKNELEISRTLKAGILLTFLAGIVGTTTLLIMSSYFIKWFKISPSFQHDALLSFEIAAIGIIPTTITSGLRGALEGLGQFASSNLSKIILGLSIFILPATSILLHGNHMWTITLYLVFARLCAVVFTAFQLKKYVLLSSDNYFRSHFKALLNYGIWVTVTGIVGPLMVYGDRFFVGAAVNAAMLPIYSIPQEALQRLLMIPIALSGALMPHLSRLNPFDSKILYHTNVKRVAIIMLAISVLATLLAYPALKWWLSEDFAIKAFPIAAILAIGLWLNSLAQIPYTLIHAKGSPKITAIFHIVELVIYLIMLWKLTLHFGLMGAATAWVIRAAIDLILLNWAASKLLRQLNL